MSAIQNIFSTLAHTARNSELLQQHAAVLTRSGYRPVGQATGYNHYVACRYSVDKPSAHAEKVALTKFRRYHQMRAANDAKIRRKLKKTSILVARLNPAAAITTDNICTHPPQFKNSAPCHHCTALLKAYGVSKVIFTTDYGEPQCQKGKSAR
jgi:hypothetical protein